MEIQPDRYGVSKEMNGSITVRSLLSDRIKWLVDWER